MIVSKKLTTEKLGENKYKITITTIEEVNRTQLASVFKENRKMVEDCKKGIADIEDYLKGNENIEKEVCND